MQQFLDEVSPMVNAFFQSAYPNYPTPRGIVYVARGQRVASACGGYSDSMAYEFCGADDRIYVGQDMLWQFYQGAGDVAPVVGLAHEWGHHLQALLREPAPRTAAQSVAYEDQADCIAGAWAQYANKQGWLEEQDDLQDITKLMQLIGSNETRARDHGTVTERTTAFNAGFEQGLKGCSL